MSNNVIPNAPDGANVLTLVSKGFDTSESGQRDVAKSCQMLAAAVMLQHREDVEGGLPDVPSFDSVYKGSRKAATVFATRMLGMCGYEYPKLEKDQERTEALVNAQRKYRSRHALMLRAVQFASHLNKAGIRPSDLDDKRKLFRVPGSLLLGEHDLATGKLHRCIESSESILLDGTSYYITHADAIRAVEASIARLCRAIRSLDYALPPGKRAPKTASALSEQGGGGFGDFGKLTQELSKIIMAGENDTAAEPVIWSDIDEQTRNALENVRLFIEDAKAREIRAQREKDVSENNANNEGIAA